MIRNLILLSFRNLLKDKAYSVLNILGLTIGITCSLFLVMYIIDELSYDRYHKNATQIYRIVSNIQEPDNAFTWAVAQKPLGPELRDNYPEVENVVRFDGMNRNLYKNGDLQFYEDAFFMTDSTVFEMFSYEFVAGDPSTALDAPFSMVLTEKMAIKYFGNAANALNSSLQNQQSEEFKITGVIRDVPLNSHFRFDGLISENTRPQQFGGWGNFGTTTYIQLPKDYDLNRMQESMEKILKEKVNPIFASLGITIQYELQPILDIHLHSKIQDEAEAGGDISYIYIFGAVAAFMILIACINYMNLATARSTNRAKEVGLRKVMGSQRLPLVMQFLIESTLVTLIALGVSILLVYAFLPVFNSMANKQMTIHQLFQPSLLMGLVAIVVVTGILGGSYPALYLSSFKPAEVLKGKLASKSGNAAFRKGLVILQFGLSIFMLISTLVVFNQLQFLRAKDLGFNKENVVRLNLSTRALQTKGRVLTEQLRRLPQVAAVGMASSSPGESIGKNVFKVEDADGKMVDRGVDLYAADYDFVDAMGMKIVEGRNFSRENLADTTFAILVNESMVKRMGWKDPMGKQFTAGDGPNGFKRQVVGVVQDYNQNSLYDEIEPLIILLNTRLNYVFIRLAPGDLHTSVNALEAEWKTIYPNAPFEYTFLDEDLQSQYSADEKRSRIFTTFSTLTIVIACLGLLGLAAYTTEQRTKEIGVRKVIGASVNGLVMLMSREFFLLVGAGMLLAFPAAWYFTDKWLENFAYRIELNQQWPTFTLAAAMAFVITLLTVGYHVVRAALANPVNSLRNE